MGIAAPIFDAPGAIIAALGVGCLAMCLPAKLRQVVRERVAAANALSRPAGDEGRRSKPAPVSASI
jgi:DNA-binding IclR family transcriptional regulator